MSEYDFTTGCKILLIATLFLLVGFIIAVIYETTGIFAFILLGTTLLSLSAMYTAATYMSISTSFQRSKFVYDKPREGSAAFPLGLAAASFALFPFILVVLSEGWDVNVVLSAMLGGFGGFLELIGAIKVNIEWEE
ncbi:MAG: hypothetical protein JW779_06550 [Candidatus Thorarchaeota archaeon]|nr:hypothetical protein [Candidatus Thorarchaeota archaeon]